MEIPIQSGTLFTARPLHFRLLPENMEENGGEGKEDKTGSSFIPFFAGEVEKRGLRQFAIAIFVKVLYNI
jgi:hypothetical protein